MKSKDIIQLLESSEVPFIIHEHPPVFTVEQADVFKAEQPGGHCKNMLLTNKNRTEFFLIILESHKRMNFKEIGALIGVKHLKFAKETTLNRFGTIAGAVSPFILLEDKKSEIKLFIDQGLKRFDRLNFHPNDNSMTLGIESESLYSFLSKQNHEPHWIEY